MQQMVEKKVNELVVKLRQTFGEQLVSVCLYGSALVQGDASSRSLPDINVLVILETLDAGALEKASSLVQWWDKTAHALPIFMSRAEWLQSADVFALEYADIRDRHQVVYGEDLYSGVEVHRDALRLVCELELNRKLILLRQQLLVNAGNHKQLLSLLHESVGSFATLFRGVLRLESGSVPQEPGEVFDHLSDVIPGFDVRPFHRVLASKRQGGSLSKPEVLPLFQDYLGQIDRVNTYVNGHFAFQFEETRV